jgi:hypothetical protein
MTTALLTDDEEFARPRELVDRLLAPGCTDGHLSASEVHEVGNWMGWAIDEVARLRAERDEARRLLTEARANDRAGDDLAMRLQLMTVDRDLFARLYREAKAERDAARLSAGLSREVHESLRLASVLIADHARPPISRYAPALAVLDRLLGAAPVPDDPDARLRAEGGNNIDHKGFYVPPYPREEVGAVGAFRAFKADGCINIVDCGTYEDGIGIAWTKSTRQALRIMEALAAAGTPPAPRVTAGDLGALCEHGRYISRCEDCGAEPINASVSTGALP